MKKYHTGNTLALAGNIHGFEPSIRIIRRDSEIKPQSHSCMRVLIEIDGAVVWAVPDENSAGATINRSEFFEDGTMEKIISALNWAELAARASREFYRNNDGAFFEEIPAENITYVSE